MDVALCTLLSQWLGLNTLAFLLEPFWLMPTIVSEFYLSQLEWSSMFNEFTFIPRYGVRTISFLNTLAVVTYHLHKCVCTLGWGKSIFLEGTLDGPRPRRASSHMSNQCTYRSREKLQDSIQWVCASFLCLHTKLPFSKSFTRPTSF